MKQDIYYGDYIKHGITIVLVIGLSLFGIKSCRKYQQKRDVIVELSSTASESAAYEQFYTENAHANLYKSMHQMHLGVQLGLTPPEILALVMEEDEKMFATEKNQSLTTSQALIRDALLSNYDNCVKLAIFEDRGNISLLSEGKTPTIQSGPSTGEKVTIQLIIPSSVLPGVDKLLPNLIISPPDEEYQGKKTTTPNNFKIARSKKLAKALSNAGLIERNAYKKIEIYYNELEARGKIDDKDSSHQTAPTIDKRKKSLASKKSTNEDSINHDILKASSPDLTPVGAIKILCRLSDAEADIPEKRLPMKKLIECYLVSDRFSFGPTQTEVIYSYKGASVKTFQDLFDFVTSRITKANEADFISRCTVNKKIALHTLSRFPEEFFKQLKAAPTNSNLHLAISEGWKTKAFDHVILLRFLNNTHPNVQKTAIACFASPGDTPESYITHLKNFYSKLNETHSLKNHATEALRVAYLARYNRMLSRKSLTKENRYYLTAVRDFMAETTLDNDSALKQYLATEPKINPKWPSVLEELDLKAADRVQYVWIIDAYTKLGGTKATHRICSYAVREGTIPELQGQALFEVFKRDPAKGATLYKEMAKSKFCITSILIQHFDKAWQKEPKAIRKSAVEALAREKVNGAHYFRDILKNH